MGTSAGVGYSVHKNPADAGKEAALIRSSGDTILNSAVRAGYLVWCPRNPMVSPEPPYKVSTVLPLNESVAYRQRDHDDDNA